MGLCSHPEEFPHTGASITTREEIDIPSFSGRGRSIIAPSWGGSVVDRMWTLAGWAERRSSSAENDADEDVAASGAIEACSTVDLVRCREFTGTTIGKPMIPERRTTRIDCSTKHGSDGSAESIDLVAFQLVRRPLRGQEGPVERFVGVDVPDARQHRLVQHGRLEGS